MPMTFSITNGVGAGFLSYTVIQLLRGRGWSDIAFLGANATRWSALRQRRWTLHPLMLLVSGVFAWYFVHGVV